MDSQRGQAAVELVAALPALLLAGLIAMQLLVVGYASTLADGAAEAGALAAATGADARRAARAALPAWAGSEVEIENRNGRVTVRLKAPSPLDALSNRLQIRSSAASLPAR